MSRYVNHLIDPTYFNDAIEEFAFNYDIYVRSDVSSDEYFRETYSYEKKTIRGSLQTDGLDKNISKSGSTHSNKYRFYCKSLYRINDGDVIFYKNMWLLVKSVHEYDEWGVRSAELEMIQLTAYRDLDEYVKYINGDIII